MKIGNINSVSHQIPEDLLRGGIVAAKSGNKILARTLLLQFLEIHPRSEIGWLWLASLAENAATAVKYLKRVLELNPRSEAALNGLRNYQQQSHVQNMAGGGGGDSSWRAIHPSAKKILVVDDSATVRKLVEITLERRGYRVMTASSAIEAMSRLSESPPDLVLLDVMMPHTDGYKLCRLIKSASSTKDLPIIMLSGKSGFLDKVRGRMAGAIAYMTKPFEPTTLIKTVEEFAANAK